jgi:small-conductance mechanosensitive channel
VVIGELGEDAVIVLCRAWVSRDDFWNVLWDVNRELYAAMNAADIDFAVSKSNKIDVNILSKN